VPAGRYRIVQVADPNNLFEELDETNNETSIEIDFEMSGIIPKIEVVEPASSP
jgi:subtilase family serine protease